MTGWTFLLLWAFLKPVERRGVLLLTACPVIVGIFTMALIGVIDGNTSSIWILIKTFSLFIAMLCSYYFAGKMDRQGT